MPSPPNLYKFHVANLREIEKAVKDVSLLARATIRNGSSSTNLRSLIKLYALVLGCWAESRLKKLLHERGGFDVQERNEILSAHTKLDEWKALVDVAFRKHHNMGNSDINKISIGVAHFARYQVLYEILNQDLAIVIEIRNKLAHGQWYYPLNEDGTNVNEEHWQKINKENLLSLQFKYALLKYFAAMMHDLVVSPPTFERDFDSHFRNLEQQRLNLERRDYSKYENALISSRIRHRERMTTKSR